jgi:hypothetical protein
MRKSPSFSSDLRAPVSGLHACLCFVEEVWLFRKTDKALMKWLSFDGVNRLGIDTAEGTRQEMDMRLQHLAARVPGQQ